MHAVLDKSLKDFTAEELLKKKMLQGKTNLAQRLFSGLIKDAAMVAHIWQKCIKLSDISDSKRSAFYKVLDEQAPQLSDRHIEVWTRLGYQLQYRRKYMLDKEAGRRKPKAVQKEIR